MGLGAARAIDACVSMLHVTARDERDAIVRLTASTGVFTALEVETVGELLDQYFADAAGSGYFCLSYGESERPLGFALWGTRDLSERGYDLFWIATHPDAQRRGVGQALLAAVEARIREAGGYWLTIETSSTAPYAAARRLYERCGYQASMTLPDFYRDGDGLVVYTKRVQ